MLKWNRITDGKRYDAFAFDLLVGLEGSTKRAYLDAASDPAPTIGIGFNLRYNLEPVLRAIVGDAHWDATLEERLQSVIDRSYASGETSLLNSRLDAVMRAWRSDEDATVPASFTFSSDDEIAAALDAIAPAYDAMIDRWIAAIPESRERAVLFSMTYNAPSLLGPKLKAAVLSGDRAEAWYEIRFNSNGSAIPGIANRRYVEAEHFRLFRDEDTATRKEALDAGRMYADHRGHILWYEATYDPDAAGAIKGLPGVDAMLAEYAPAIARLKAVYDVGKAFGSEELQVATAARTRLEGDGTSAGSKADDADLLIGAAQANRLLGGKGADALIGLGGADILKGSTGQDWLQGGIGADRLAGGGGADRFVFRSAAEIGGTATGGDVILDFVPGRDVIDLSPIDANRSLTGHRFLWLDDEGAAFSGEAGELRWYHDAAGGRSVTRVEGDLDGDGQADFSLQLQGRLVLTADDFLL
ncbi:M10 family metallopeptidase C-terminal domain-containing protein [Rhizobium sp. TRM95111]|uniref:M10 family metallopeptidase C-terminal domain-containing protein n=1 Tax=Rhizobium alarense TaxID=2846851 RepID=UPI001F278854|nr:M10 family metallopeptidase C-terminal domain-containing protein [Rhizobium alarense]MCF3640518.1 M10 family metallopeptidase C-terminal domain-containing protein [Rhizobium alarense]